MTLAAPAAVARRTEEPLVEHPSPQPDQSRATQIIDVNDLAERVYRLMLHDTLIDQERKP